MQLRLTKLMKRSQINKSMVEFAYMPEYPDYEGLLKNGGYLYREGKERFKNNSV